MSSNNGVTTADLRDVQGNVVGFNKDHQRLLFVNFPDGASGQRFVAAIANDADNAADVRAYNERRATRLADKEDPLSEPADWVNVALSFNGLTQISARGISTFPAEFQAGMRGRASGLGDVDASDPGSWVGAFAPGQPAVHAVVIIAADLPDLLNDRTDVVQQIIQDTGVTMIDEPQEGNIRPGDMAGHEHFGFKDGISQPSIAGVTRSSKGGPDIAPGEFLIGYEDQDGSISGQAIPQPTPQPGQPGYPAPAPPQPQPLPDWCKNGSFLVYRRLRQDVGGFISFVTSEAETLGITPDQLGAKLVGRWKTGAPLEHVPGEPPDLDTAAADPSNAHPNVLDANHINNFGYLEHDADGHLTPRAAHIRKAYPRDEPPPGAEEANRHRILRRGIVYGAEFDPSEPAYGTDPVPADQDRGLLFLCYQSSIPRGFEFIQTSWANQPDFPQPGDGEDPIISQNVEHPPFTLPPNTHLATNRWVTTTGGEYFFAPAISALKLIGEASSDT